MGDLVRQRRARDLWISRGHLRAGVVGVAVGVMGAFTRGYSVGVRSADDAVPAATQFTSEVPTAALVELLARVETSASRNGGVDALTFPEALRGGLMGPTQRVDGGEDAALRQLLAADAQVRPPVDDRPPGRFTVEVQHHGDVIDARELRDVLRNEGMAAWVGVERIDGEVLYRVSVGGFGKKSEAESALGAVAALLPAAAPKLIER